MQGIMLEARFAALSGERVAMTIIQAEAPPLQMDESGTIRVGGTRVTLETIVELYKDGHTADELRDAFPTVSLADIHTVIGYYLRHRREVDAYLEGQQREGVEIRRKLEAQPGNAELRQRLQAIKRSREDGRGASAPGG